MSAVITANMRSIRFIMGAVRAISFPPRRRIGQSRKSWREKRSCDVGATTLPAEASAVVPNVGDLRKTLSTIVLLSDETYKKKGPDLFDPRHIPATREKRRTHMKSLLVPVLCSLHLSCVPASRKRVPAGAGRRGGHVDSRRRGVVHGNRTPSAPSFGNYQLGGAVRTT